MRIKFLSFLLVAILSVSTAWVSFAPVFKGDANGLGGVNADVTANGNELKILKSADKLTQEQVASQIKAEYLI